MATRFLATREAAVHPAIQRLLLDASERDTTLNLKGLLAPFGMQVRAYRNAIMEQVDQVEREGGDFSALFPLISGQRARPVWQTGDVDQAMLTIGQSVGLVHDIPSVADLVTRIVDEARAALAGAQASLA